jgi:N-acetylglucosaminyldiphosphoundecaprenol N-acetyl-beta-D-mannosaminyltransferase
MDEAIEILDGFIHQRGFHQVATANINFLMNGIDDSELVEILQTCSLVVPDGMPLVWASQMMGTPLKERVTGYNLVPRLAQLAAEQNYGIFLLGASEECSAGAAAWIERNHPGARIVGRYSPPFGPLHTMDHANILRRVEQAKPDILLVALGNPKQEKWLAMHRRQLQVPVAIGVGGALNFLAGQATHAPRWMQKHGLESMYRVWKEPRRLGARYLSDFCGACRFLTMQVLAVGMQSRNPGPQRISYFWIDGTLVIRPEGRFMGDLVTEFERFTATSNSAGLSVLVDLSQTKSLGADALAALISLNSGRQAGGCQLALTGIRGAVGLVLAASRIHDQFRIVPAPVATSPIKIPEIR